MSRFPTLAVPLLAVTIALFNLGVELLGLDPELGPLVGWRQGRGGLPGAYVLGSWLLEALGLTALYVLVASPERPRWMSGLLTGWIAWVFRGPLLVLAAVAVAGQPGAPWWRLSLRWLVLYTLAGLLLGAVARWTRLETHGAAGGAADGGRPDRPGPEAVAPAGLEPTPVELPLHDTAGGDALGLALDADRAGGDGPTALGPAGDRGGAEDPDDPEPPDDERPNP